MRAQFAGCQGQILIGASICGVSIGLGYLAFCGLEMTGTFLSLKGLACIALAPLAVIALAGVIRHRYDELMAAKLGNPHSQDGALLRAGMALPIEASIPTTSDLHNGAFSTAEQSARLMRNRRNVG